jgi:hypothetical protein
MITTTAVNEVVRQDVRIRNIRLCSPRLTDNGVVGDVVGDLWVVRHNGTTMIASGKIKFLYEICNRENFNLLNYAESISNIKTLKEFNEWQRKELMPRKRFNKTNN